MPYESMTLPSRTEPRDRKEQIRGWIWHYAACLSQDWWVSFDARETAMYRARLDYWLSQTMPKINMDSLR